MTRAICAASARGAPGRTSCNQPVRHEQSLETDHQQAALRCFVPVNISVRLQGGPKGPAHAADSAPWPSLTPRFAPAGQVPIRWREGHSSGGR